VTQLITTELVELDQNLGNSPETVIRHLASKVAATGRASEVEGLFADAFAREQKTATGIPGGIAIPHCRSAAVNEPTLAMARLDPKVDFGAKDGPADLIFFIAAPDGADQQHLKLLSKLARSLIKKDFTAALRNASSREEIVELVDGALADKPAAHAAAAPDAVPVGAAVGAGSSAPAGSTATGSAGSASRGPKRLVAVTACPTGIAHTYMAADSLVAAAQEAGVDL
jgi:fructose PTS system EIIBC or EIIC component